MSEVVWSLPLPSTALLKGVQAEHLPRRVLRLSMSYEVDDRVEQASVTFGGVHRLCLTFDRARPSDHLAAYDALLDLGRTTVLQELASRLAPETPVGLRHLLFNSDDGPSYDVVCESLAIRVGSPL